MRLNANLILLLCFLFSSPALSAPTVDGSTDAEYGPPVTVQITQTAGFNNMVSRLALADGTELDQAYALVSNQVLHLMVAGNLYILPNPIDPGCAGDEIWIFFDTRAGGQNVLRGDNKQDGGLNFYNLAGLSFDTGFEPDYWVQISGDCWYQPYPDGIYVLAGDLPTNAGGAGTYLGRAPAGTGTLTGGTNPFGIQAAIDNRNVAGVTSGCDPSSGAAVETGIELSIPLAAIGNESECVRICVVALGGSRFLQQSLPPVPPGVCGTVFASSVGFSTIAGDQNFTVCAEGVAAKRSTWGAVKAVYR